MASLQRRCDSLERWRILEKEGETLQAVPKPETRARSWVHQYLFGYNCEKWN